MWGCTEPINDFWLQSEGRSEFRSEAGGIYRRGLLIDIDAAAGLSFSAVRSNSWLFLLLFLDPQHISEHRQSIEKATIRGVLVPRKHFTGRELVDQVPVVSQFFRLAFFQ